MGKARTRFVAASNYIKTTYAEAQATSAKYGKECMYCNEYYPNVKKDSSFICKPCYTKSRC